MRVTIFDYGAGNLHSLQTALAPVSSDVVIEADASRCIETDVLVLPGVGAFAQAAARLARARVRVGDAIRAGLPTVGICLGMQLLFDRSDEGVGEGLGVIAGRVTRLDARRVPHIGWNVIEADGDPALSTSRLAMGYFANGFACRPSATACVTAWATHESDRFPAIVRAHRAIGVQFHPEKSSRVGAQFLGSLIEECRA